MLLSPWIISCDQPAYRKNVDKCHALGLCNAEACTALLGYSYAKQLIAILLLIIKTKYGTLFWCAVIPDSETVTTVIRTVLIRVSCETAPDANSRRFHGAEGLWNFSSFFALTAATIFKFARNIPSLLLRLKLTMCDEIVLANCLSYVPHSQTITEKEWHTSRIELINITTKLINIAHKRYENTWHAL